MKQVRFQVPSRPPEPHSNHLQPLSRLNGKESFLIAIADQINQVLKIINGY